MALVAERCRRGHLAPAWRASHCAQCGHQLPGMASSFSRSVPLIETVAIALRIT
jgi:hypothetical protein